MSQLFGNNQPHKKPPLELRLRVLSAIDYAPGDSVRARIKSVATRTFSDEQTGCNYQFTWRTHHKKSIKSKI